MKIGTKFRYWIIDLSKDLPDHKRERPEYLTIQEFESGSWKKGYSNGYKVVGIDLPIGRCDRNGKQIYVGDMCEITIKSPRFNGGKECIRKAIVHIVYPLKARFIVSSTKVDKFGRKSVYVSIGSPTEVKITGNLYSKYPIPWGSDGRCHALTIRNVI